MPLVQHLTGATISYVDIDGNLRQLVKFTPADQKAVVLVGRTEREHVDRLMLAPEVVSELRVEMQKPIPRGYQGQSRKVATGDTE